MLYNTGDYSFLLSRGNQDVSVFGQKVLKSRSPDIGYVYHIPDMISVLSLVTLLYLYFITVTVILVHHQGHTALHFPLAHLVVVHLLVIVKQWTVTQLFARKTLVFYLEHHLQLQTLSFVILNYAQNLKNVSWIETDFKLEI